MKRLNTILRTFLHIIIVILMVAGGALYVLFHFDLAGLVMQRSLVTSLSEKLQTRVTVEGDVDVDWKNQVVINHLTIYDQHDDTLLYARRVMVAYDLLPLLHHHLVLNTCQLIDFDIRASRPSTDSVANYQFMIDALASNDTLSQPFLQQVDLNAILLRQGRLRYDVSNRPYIKDLPVDPYHVCIDQLSANLHIHDTRLLIKKFHCQEHDNAIRLERGELSLDFASIRQASDGEHRPMCRISEFNIASHLWTLRADINGDSDAIHLLIHELSLQGEHPRLPHIERLSSTARIRVSQWRNPIDSLEVHADIDRLDLLTEPYGQMLVSGTLTGMPCQFSLYGRLKRQEAEALIQADIVRNDSHSVDLTGHCTARRIDLSLLTGKSSRLGIADMDVDFGIKQQPETPLLFSANGDIDRLEWRGHTYRQMQVRCDGNKQLVSGEIAFCDSLGNVNAEFDIDLNPRHRHYRLQGEVAHLNPVALHLCDIDQLDSLSISTGFSADIHANPMQDQKSSIRFSDIVLHRFSHNLSVGSIDFSGTAHNGRLHSPIANMQYSQRPSDGEYLMSGRIPVINDVLDMLRIPIEMSREVKFEVRLDSLRHLSQAYLDLPRIVVGHSLSAQANFRVNDDEYGALFPVLDLELQNASHRLAGTLKATMNGRITEGPLSVDIEPTTFVLDNEDVQLTGARISRDEKGAFSVDDIRLKGGQQEISATGTWGRNGNRDFVLSLENFDLGQIFSDLPKGYMHIGGRASGDIVISGGPDMYLRADSLRVRHLAYIDTLLGNADMSLQYSSTDRRAFLSAHILTGQQYHSHLDMSLAFGKRDTMDLLVRPDHLPIGFINYWSGNVLQQFSGTATGDVRVYGDLKMLQLAGQPLVDGHFTHQTIGARFHLNDTVKLGHNYILLDHILVDDEHGHRLLLDARVTHDHLHRFGYDVSIDMPDARQGFLIMNREQKPGRIYWGQLFAKGQAHLMGGNGTHKFDIDFTPTSRSWFFLSPREQDFNPDQEAYSFLTFRDKHKLEQELQAAADSLVAQLVIPADISTDSRTQIDVTMKINATEDCEVTVRMDPTSDDLLVCRGNGGLTLNYNTLKDITLSGTYNITQGTYTMNVKPDLLNKVFKLQGSSSIRFNGVPSEAELALDARYNIPSVNLYDLGEDIIAISSLSRSSVPVDCMLNVSGQLSSPQVGFDLELKNVSEELKTNVHNIIGTPEMLNQEVLYLLLFSKFYTPQYAQATQSRTGSELTSFASASITSQLNQLLNRLSDNFTMGTNFRSDRGDFTDMEMDLSLSTRLLGNRLLLYGNLGYRDPANRIGALGNSTSLIGDFDAEYLVNRKRTIRFKAYSHYNERDYSINNALTTQGAGFNLRRDFNSLLDLWWWRRKKSQK